MWKKLVGGDKKKDQQGPKEYKNIWEEILQDQYKVELKEVWKLNSTELGEAVKKYETYGANLKKELKKAEEDRDIYKTKFTGMIEERNRLADEREEL